MTWKAQTKICSSKTNQQVKENKITSGTTCEIGMFLCMNIGQISWFPWSCLHGMGPVYVWIKDQIGIVLLWCISTQWGQEEMLLQQFLLKLQFILMMLVGISPMDLVVPIKLCYTGIYILPIVFLNFLSKIISILAFPITSWHKDSI